MRATAPHVVLMRAAAPRVVVLPAPAPDVVILPSPAAHVVAPVTARVVGVRPHAIGARPWTARRRVGQSAASAAPCPVVAPLGASPEPVTVIPPLRRASTKAVTVVTAGSRTASRTVGAVTPQTRTAPRTVTAVTPQTRTALRGVTAVPARDRAPSGAITFVPPRGAAPSGAVRVPTAGSAAPSGAAGVLTAGSAPPSATVAGVSALGGAARRAVPLVPRTPAGATVAGRLAPPAGAHTLVAPPAAGTVIPRAATAVALPVLPFPPGTAGATRTGTVRAVPSTARVTRTAGWTALGAVVVGGFLGRTAAEVVVVPERQVQGIGSLARLARRVLRRRRAARPL
ncbi:hypothetical protein [Nonomuraea sp. NPDC049480]|uniref:hypothetical protein n=1 Tax=Nonomuraea sp. NPDC049480 TaxID=3364353 RepID=UPI0037A99B61